MELTVGGMELTVGGVELTGGSMELTGCGVELTGGAQTDRKTKTLCLFYYTLSYMLQTEYSNLVCLVNQFLC